MEGRNAEVSLLALVTTEEILFPPVLDHSFVDTVLAKHITGPNPVRHNYVLHLTSHLTQQVTEIVTSLPLR